jgi:hypothetical protein
VVGRERGVEGSQPVRVWRAKEMKEEEWWGVGVGVGGVGGGGIVGDVVSAVVGVSVATAAAVADADGWCSKY